MLVLDVVVVMRSYKNRFWVLDTVVIVIWVDNRIVGCPCKNELVGGTVVGLFGEGNGMHSVDNMLWGGELGPFSTGESLIGDQGHEGVGSLAVASWVHGNGGGGARELGVAGFVFVMYLAVRAKRDAAVSLKISGDASNDGAGAEAVGNAVLVGKHVEPGDSVFDELALEELGVVFVR